MEIEPPNPERQQNPLRFIIFNERELRAGWRLLIAVTLFFVISNSLFFLLRPILHRLPRGMAPSAMIFQEALGFGLVALVTWIMSKIERRNMGEYGLPLRATPIPSLFVRGFILWGFIPLSLLLLVLRSLDKFYFGNLALHDGQILLWGLIWGFFFCLVGLTEEYSLRGYLLYTLADGIGFWPAAIVLAALFGAGHSHNPGESRIGILMAALFGLVAAVMLRYTGNLWLAVGAHAGWDWGESYFYGVNDSGLQIPGHLLNPHVQGPSWLNGGSVGPEGSILCLVLMVAMALLFARFYSQPRKPLLVANKL